VEPALHQARDRASWRWARTAGTQRALLDAAREVFVDQGFAEASIAEVVKRAGSSVGSLYHHFGGKSELFIALWDEHQAAYDEAVERAITREQRAGATEPLELFTAAARAFLDDTWERRDLALLFFAGDDPAGFEVTRRRRGQEWIVRNNTLLGLSGSSFDRLYVAILISLITEAAREVAAAANRRQANRVTEAALEYVRRLMADGPWSPPRRPGVARDPHLVRPAARLSPRGCRPAGRGPTPPG
jgi:AcrR family transcriptional regulator